jgi:oligopeptide transport system substrate-binding protein
VDLGAAAPTSRGLARRLTALVALSAAAACTTPPTEEAVRPVPGPTATVATSLRIAVEPTASLDPRALESPDSLLLASQLFDGLVTYDPKSLDVLPAAAVRWDVRDQGRTFVFRLRKGMRFHNGSPVRARDFVFAWNRLADPVDANPFAFLLEPVAGFDEYQEQLQVTGMEGLDAPNDRTLVVRLSSPWPDFVALLGHPALSPVPPVASRPEYAQRPIGNGPYRLSANVEAGVPIQMEAFRRYLGGEPGVARLEIQAFEDPAEAWPEFLEGGLDVAQIPVDVLPDAVSRFGTRGLVTLARLLYCGFNLDQERFRDPSLRAAVSMAIDRQALVAEVYGGAAEPAGAIVPPSIPGGGSRACGAACIHDLERAQALVDELPKASRSFSLDYATSPVGDQLAATVASQLGAVGLEVRPQGHDAAAYASLLGRREHEMFCLVWVADLPRQQGFLAPLLRSGSPDNHTGVEDRRLDDLLGKARDERSPAARLDLYHRVEARALELMPVVPLVWFRSHLAVQPFVQGFTIDPLARFDAAALRVAG